MSHDTSWRALRASVPVTAASTATRVALRTAGDPIDGQYTAVLIDSRATEDVFVLAGDATVTAALNTGLRVPAGAQITWDVGQATHLSLISASGNAAVYWQLGSGRMALPAAGAGGGGTGSTAGLATEATLAAVSAKLPTTSPQQGSGPVTPATLRATLASDGPAVTEISALATATGAKGDTAATDDTGTWSLASLLKRVAGRLTSLLGATSAFTPGTTATVGALTAATSSGAIAVTVGSVVRISNAGGSTVGVVFGGSSVVATAANTLDIMGGAVEAFTVPAGTGYMACYSASAVAANVVKYTIGTGA